MARRLYPSGPVFCCVVALLVFASSVLEPALGDVFTNVSEAVNDGYQLLYDLDIPNTAAFNSAAIPYSTNNSATNWGPISRVAYYLELDSGSGPQYAYVSMDAFSQDAAKLGIPSRGPAGNGGVDFQQFVSNMNVFSNSPNVTAGTGITTGNIEFWPNNYQANNTGQNSGHPAALSVPNSSGGVFDFGDRQSTGGYGSMQIHNYDIDGAGPGTTGQTIMAYNRWGSGNGELGIGNRTTSDPDWTFADNASSYTSKKLQVLVQPVAPDVEEARDFTLVHKLSVPTNSPGYNAAEVPYSIDNSAEVTHPIERIAYYVELQKPGQSLEYVYVSMDAFTQDATKIGVPSAGPNGNGGTIIQRNLSNMNVVSNSPNVTQGTGIATGNIEFFPRDYGKTNVASVPNASASTYDLGDDPRTSGGHGSMQIHNYDIDGAGSGTQGETIFAYNAWGTARTSSLGIGTNTTGTGDPDWTFNYNAGDYEVKNIYTMVKEVAPQVDEAADYKLAYKLSIDDQANYGSGDPPYTINNISDINQPFDRVAYYLELQKPGGEIEYAYVSMDAFTTDISKIGVPTSSSGAVFQQTVANMNVESNVAGVTNGTGIATGNIEFWPTDYSRTNTAGVPGASNSSYDLGDSRSSGGTYGSMQIHNHETGSGHTIMAFNRWGGSSGDADLGIGNRPASGDADWTFAQNADDYTIKNLYVMVREDATPGVFRNVPEAADYTLVHSLAIPDEANNFNANSVPYSVDNSSAITGPIDRIAYYVELQGDAGDLQYAYVSMDAFTQDATQIGIPTLSSGANFQSRLSHMNVASNVAGVISGTDLAGGIIEFWPSNYGADNAAGVPGASGSVYDFGDMRRDDGLTAGYGSMQIHNFEAAQTIFAYNKWGQTGESCLGIGNQPGDHPDWTHSLTSGNYRVKNLYTLVHEADAALLLSNPTGRSVLQRDENNRADVTVEGLFAGDVTRIEARAVPMAGYGGEETSWQVIDDAPTGGSFSSSLDLAGGWYEIQVRAFNDTELVAENSVERIGVGEVFITAGQSNSANSGSTPVTPADERVSAWTGGMWQFAGDPQPIATGTGGSPWPTMADHLVDAFDVPIGLVSVGWGGTSISQWQPGGSLYPRLEEALETLGPEGFRAVLWHQGESDAGAGTSTEDYVAGLENIIAQSRMDAGWDVLWGVALASYRPGFGSDEDIINAQLEVIANDSLVFLGAMTDDMIVPYRDGTDYTGIHFNEAGLREHGYRWYLQLFPIVVPEPHSFLLLATGILFLARRRRKMQGGQR